MRAEQQTALDAIDAEFEEPVFYTGAGLDNEQIGAIRSDTPASSFDGPGNTLREISYEIRQSVLPERPHKNDIIVDGADHWKVNDVTRRDDIGKWLLIVVKA